MTNEKIIVTTEKAFMPEIKMSEDIEKQRKTLVFSAENRLRLAVQAVTIEQTGTAEMRRVRKAGSTRRFKLSNTVSALTKIETLFTGYGHEQLIDAGLMATGTTKLWDANKAACTVMGTKDMLMVTLDGIGRKKHPVRKITKFVVKHGLWLVECPYAEGGMAFVFKNKRGIFQSLNGAVQNLNTDGFMDRLIQSGMAHHFMYFIDSPSGYRQGMVPMIRIPASTEEALEWLENVLNIATGGMYFVERAANAGKNLRIDKGIKKVGREALGITPSTFLGYLNNLCIYVGDLKSTTVDEYYFVEAEEEFHWHEEHVAGDGNGFEALEAVQKMAEEKFGYPISEAEVHKFGGQHRINSFVKGHNQVVKRRAILAFIDYLVETGRIKGVIEIERTFEDSVKFAQIMGNPAYEGYLAIIGDLENVEYFGDTTCVKCSTDFSQPLELRLMDISHTPHGFLPLSKQDIVQMQLTGKCFEDMYREVAPMSMDRIFNHVEFDMIDELEEEFATDADASGGDYAVSFLQKVAPQAVNYDEQIKRIATQSVVDTLNNRLNRCNLTVSGKYLKLAPDIGRLVNAKLLEADEFYSPGWEHEEDETGFDAVITRYPLVDFGAFIKGRAVSRREMVKRIRRLRLTPYYEDMMFDFLNSVTGAMIMIASMVPGTTNKLSGADFDGDGASAKKQLAVKRVYAKLDSYADNFGGSCPGNVEAPFNYDLGPTSFLYAWALDDDDEDRLPNPAIGIVAGYNVTVSSILAEVLAGIRKPDEVFHWFLDEDSEDDKGNPIRIPAEPGELEYHRQFTVDGSDDLGVDVSFAGHEDTYVDEFKQAVALSDWSLGSCIRMLWDLNAVLSKSMNDVIDAAKNGAQVEVPFLDRISSRVRSSAVASKDYASIKMSRSELKIEKFTDICGSEESKNEQQKMTILTEDPIGLMKHRIFELAVLRLRRALRDEVEQDMAEVSGGKDIDNSLKLLAAFYQDLMKAEGNDKALAKKQVVNMAYALFHQAGITDPEKILGMVLKASNYAEEDEVPHRYTSFYIQFAEVIRHYVEKFCKDARFELRVYKYGGGKACVGQKVIFINGVSEDGFYVKSRLNGEFCLELNEKNQAVISRKVLDMVPEQEGNDRIAVMRVWKQFHGTGRDRVCLDPEFNVANRISRIESLRERKGFKCCVKLFNPTTEQFVEKDLRTINMNEVVPALVSTHGPIGYIQIPKGNGGAYLRQILGKEYTITNVMRMGRKQETVCVVAEEIR